MEHPLRERLTNFHLHGIALDENGMPISTMLCTSMTPVSIFALTAIIRFSYSLYSLKSSDDAAKYSLVICNGCNDLNGRNDHAKVVNPVLLIFFYLFFIFLSDCCCSL